MSIVWHVVDCTLLAFVASGLVFVWYELREMRKRAGLMPPPKTRPKPPRKL